VKILRVLGERTFERVGGNQTLQADVRLIAATNRDLTAMVAGGTFREDLYFRLNVVPLTMPPLRDHREDIPLLVDAFGKEMAREHGKPARRFDPVAMELLETYGWPGNIRELRAAVEHAVVLGAGTELTSKDLPSSIRASSEPGLREGELNLARIEEAMIRKALAECADNRTLAAKSSASAAARSIVILPSWVSPNTPPDHTWPSRKPSATSTPASRHASSGSA